MEFKEALDAIKAEHSKTSAEISELIKKQDAEIEKHGGSLTETSKKMGELEQSFQKQLNDFQGVVKSIEEMEAKMGRPNFGGAEQEKTLGQQFIESSQYTDAQKAGLKRTDAFEVKNLFDTKATVDSAGAVLLRNVYKYPSILFTERQLTIRDVMNVQSITAGSIEYIEETSFTNNANWQVEGQAKAESALAWNEKTAPVRTLAHFIPATRQIMDDAPMLRNYIDNRLLYGLKVVEEDSILFGAGTGASLEGLMVNANVQNAGKMMTKTMIDHIRHSLTMARVAGYPPTGIILNPADWEAIELSKGTDGHYIFINVNDGGIPRLFRVPVIESVAMTAGSFLTGAFGLACQLLDREQANVRVAEQHADFFTKNMVAILAEERVAMPVYRPQAMVKGSFATT